VKFYEISYRSRIFQLIPFSQRHAKFRKKVLKYERKFSLETLVQTKITGIRFLIGHSHLCIEGHKKIKLKGLKKRSNMPNDGIIINEEKG